ncbi:hypothetical protein M901_1789 [Bacteriovorax sp. DB6_IX]|nr:hypothetical protein M901_1789 [Bacteriovorax sp. DB6_IX]
MNHLSNFARSMNETHRICTHEISGHLHLLRFCIDELMSEADEDNKLMTKLEEGVTRLENLNKLWKVCTRFLDPEVETSLLSSIERGVGLATLYNQKFLEEIDYDVKGEISLPLNRAILLAEAIFSACSIICHFAVKQNISAVKLQFEVVDEDKGIITVASNVNKVSRQEVLEILEFGNENEKSLRRQIGAATLTEFGGKFDYLDEDEKLKVRISL